MTIIPETILPIILEGTSNSLPVHIISEKDNGDQRRTHKKKRINKKWRKRYGLVSAPVEKGQCFVFKGVGIFMSRKTYIALKKGLKEYYQNEGKE